MNTTRQSSGTKGLVQRSHAPERGKWDLRRRNHLGRQGPNQSPMNKVRAERGTRGPEEEKQGVYAAGRDRRGNWFAGGEQRGSKKHRKASGRIWRAVQLTITDHTRLGGLGGTKFKRLRVYSIRSPHGEKKKRGGRGTWNVGPWDRAARWGRGWEEREFLLGAHPAE